MKRPNNPALDIIETLVGDIFALETRLAELRQEVRDQTTAWARIEDPNERLQLASYAYWYIPETKVEDLAFAALRNSRAEHQLRKLVGPITANLACGRCQATVPITSRTQMTGVLARGKSNRPAYAEGYRVLCKDCRVIVMEERSKAYEAERVTAEKFAREWQQKPYSEYLASNHWKQKRAELMRLMLPADRDDRGCEVCNSRDRLDVYHRSLEYVAGPLYAGLLILCAPCGKALAAGGRVLAR
jgi:hypothetical protein